MAEEVVECLPPLDDRVDNEKMFEGDSCTYTCKLENA